VLNVYLDHDIDDHDHLAARLADNIHRDKGQIVEKTEADTLANHDENNRQVLAVIELVNMVNVT